MSPKFNFPGFTAVATLNDSQKAFFSTVLLNRASSARDKLINPAFHWLNYMETYSTDERYPHWHSRDGGGGDSGGSGDSGGNSPSNNCYTRNQQRYQECLHRNILGRDLCEALRDAGMRLCDVL